MTLPLFQLQYLLSKLDSRSHSIHSCIYSREEAECVLANLDYEKYYFAVSADAPLIIRATPYSERVGDEVVGTMGFCALDAELLHQLTPGGIDGVLPNYAHIGPAMKLLISVDVMLSEWTLIRKNYLKICKSANAVLGLVDSELRAGISTLSGMRVAPIRDDSLVARTNFTLTEYSRGETWVNTFTRRSLPPEVFDVHID